MLNGLGLFWGWGEERVFVSDILTQGSSIPEDRMEYYDRQQSGCTECASMRAVLFQPWLTLCSDMDCNLPGSSDLGILQERTLE